MYFDKTLITKFKTMKHCIFIVLCILTLNTYAQAPKREFRGAWLHTVSGDYQGLSVDKMKNKLLYEIETLHQAGINAVIFQVRPAADSFYRSKLEPWSRYLTGKQGKAPLPSWDPLAFVIQACHERSMELHAWVNPYRVRLNPKHQLAPNHIYHKHPEWFVTYGKQLFFNPGLPQCRRFICDVVNDIIYRYDVDGIHMDDYFYPYPKKGIDFEDNITFAQYGKGFTNKNDWRRYNVNTLIRELHNIIRKTKPWVKFGVSPFGIYRNEKSDPNGSKTNGLQNYDDLYADVLLWINKGWIDYSAPQLYWEIGHKAADYETLINWWARNAYRRPLFIGESVVRTTRTNDLMHPEKDQMQRKFELERYFPTVNGACLWPGIAVIENVGNYAQRLKTNYYKYPAIPPVFTFMDNEKPHKVKHLRDKWTAEGHILTWNPPYYKEEMNRPVNYVVYRFKKGEKINLDLAEKIVTITRNTKIKLPQQSGKEKYVYVVTALDRLHNESKPKKENVKL